MYIYGTFSICRFLFCQRFENSKCYIYSGGRFLCRSLEAVILCFLASFSAVYSSFDIQSYFKLVDKFIQQIWVSFLFSSKYDEGIHDNIHSWTRSVFHSIHGCMVKDTWLPVPGCSHPKIFLKYFSQLLFSFFFFISNRVPTKPRVKSWNVACTLGRMQSPLLIIIFLCLQLTF